METEINYFDDIGSVDNFAATRGIDPTDPETVRQYGQELVERRVIIARSIGLTPDQFRIKPTVNTAG